MARLVKVFRRRFRIGDRQDRRRAIIRADAGGHAARGVHRNGEIGPMRFAVLCDHSLQAKLLGALI